MGHLEQECGQTVDDYREKRLEKVIAVQRVSSLQPPRDVCEAVAEEDGPVCEDGLSSTKQCRALLSVGGSGSPPLGAIIYW